MRRPGSVIVIAVYTTALLAATIAHAQVLPVKTGFSAWLWTGVDWHDYASAALASLIGGVFRTVATLRSQTPTFRVFLETLGDAVTALISGLVVFIFLMGWQSASGPVSHPVTFGLLFAAGWLRVGFITLLDDALKRIFAAGTDAAVSWIAVKAGAMTKENTEGKP